VAASESYYDVIREAVADMSEHGFDSAERVAYWQDRIARAAERSMRTARQMEDDLREAMASIYKRLVDQGKALDVHLGASRFTIDRLRPELRAELDRRIMASADLIRLNRTKAKEQTLQRFSGWATSLPKGKSKTTDRRDETKRITKALKDLPFEVRRLHIDQGHKLAASINETIARGGGAIGLVWRSHWRQPGYNYREDHKERDRHFYMLKGNWAAEKGLVKPGPDGWYENITAVGQAPFCRCWASYVYNLRDVPDACMTAKGRAELERVRAVVAAL